MPLQDLERVMNAHRRWLDSGGNEGSQAVLIGASLAGHAFWRADLSSAILDRCNFGGCNLDHASLHATSLRDARLERASLWQADLREADLSNANLRGAKLDHADLRGGLLYGADLTDASFWGARLEGADLRRATGLTPRQLAPAKRDDATQLEANILSSF